MTFNLIIINDYQSIFFPYVVEITLQTKALFVMTGGKI